MDYSRLAEEVSVEEWSVLSDRLVDLLLTSKNDVRMTRQLANIILYNWQRDLLATKSGLTALLEAAVLLEPENTIAALIELQLTNIAEQLKTALRKT